MNARITLGTAGAALAAFTLAQKVVAADPSFAIGHYYLSAVAPPPDNAKVLRRPSSCRRTRRTARGASSKR